METNIKKLIEKIKSKGYWEINIHPVVHNAQLIPNRAGAREIVRKAVVSLRGWDYPHFSDRYGEPYIIENGVEKMTDLDQYVELWRMTQSGNFYHLLGLREDRIDKSYYNNMWSRGDELEGKDLLGALGTLYTLVEIFEFAKRLSQEEIFASGLVINIKLHNLTERHLYVDGTGRIPFSFPRISRTSNPWSWNKSLNKEELEDIEKLVLPAYLDLIELFGWENPPLEVFKADIEKFLSGRL